MDGRAIGCALQFYVTVIAVGVGSVAFVLGRIL
jgi:hypothetical protein